MSGECKLCVLMAKSVSDDAVSRGRRYDQHSMILVPMNTAGVRLLRPLSVFAYDDAPRQSNTHVVLFVVVLINKYFSEVMTFTDITVGWLRSTVVERRSFAGELSLFCARPAANG